eukprot:7776454-Alexandrium_andersonii.AAC.1
MLITSVQLDSSRRAGRATMADSPRGHGRAHSTEAHDPGFCTRAAVHQHPQSCGCAVGQQRLNG